MSIYPEKTIKDIHDKLDVGALLRFVNYRTDTVQEIGDQIKCFCPIHKEAVFRTLCVNKTQKNYRCSYSLCAGNRGGDLIDFYARLKGMDYDDALQELVEKMRLPVALPATGEVLERTLEEGGNFLYLMTVDETRREMYLEEATKRFMRVLEVDPRNAKALNGLYQVAQQKGDMQSLINLSRSRIEVEAAAGRFEDVIQLSVNHLNWEPENIPIRKILTDALLSLERDEEALTELMNLADLCEMHQDYDSALDAYRKIARIPVHDIDVHPMIVNLLTAAGRTQEAVDECVARAQMLVEGNQLNDAIEVLRSAIELAPERDDLRAKVVEFSLSLGLDRQRIQEAIELVDQMIARQSLEAATLILNSLCEADSQNPNLLDKLLEIKKRQGLKQEVLLLQYRLADIYKERDDFASSLLLLEEILSGAPGDIEALRRIAEIHNQEGDIAEAVRVYLEIVQHARDNKQLDQAIAAAERIIEINPTAVEYREQLVDLYIQAGRMDTALTRIMQLIGALEDLGDAAALVSPLHKALQIAPDRTDLRIKLAFALEKTGKHSEGGIQRMLAAEQLLRNGRLGEATEQLRSILAQKADDLEALSLLAEALARMGQWEESHDLLRRLADLQISASQYDEACNTLERLLNQAPEDAQALERLADVYTGLGDEDQVIATLERLIAVDRRINEWESMRKHCLAILDMRPDHIEAHQNLVLVFERLDQPAEVINTLLQLAEIHRKRHQVNEEKEVLSAILQRSPGELRVLRRQAALVLDMIGLEEGLAHLDTFLQAAAQSGAEDDAIGFLRELLAKNPEEAELHRRLIDWLKQTQRTADAAGQIRVFIALQQKRQSWGEVADLYKELLEFEPQNLKNRSNRIEVLLRLQRRDEAIEELLQLSIEFERQGLLDDAEQTCAEILKNDAVNEPAHRRLIEISRRRANLPQAAEWLFKLASLQIQNGRHLDAIMTLQEVFDFDPLNVDTHKRIIALHIELGLVDDALAEYRTLVEIHRQTGDNDAAIQCQRDAIALRPAEPGLRRDLIQLWFELGDERQAIEELFALAQMQQTQQNFQDVLGTLAEILEHDANNLKARKMRGETFLQLGDEKQALQEYLALSSQLENPAVMQTLARAGARESDEPEGLPLVPEYTFETYIVGDRNNFAYATGLACAKAPAKNYNPLFLYSEVGLGKTHLMHAIGHAILKTNPKAKVLYTTSEEFVAQLIDVIQNNTVTQYRQRYRNIDVLLLDDVQFLSGKERAQEEFFHIFNTLFQAKKQIVVTSDRPPKDIAHLEKRLKSRFGAGVVVDIQPPDFETRTAIIKREFQSRPDLGMTPEMIAIVAKRIETNIRELKGAINQIVATHDVTGEKLTPEAVNAVLDRVLERI